MTTVSAIYQKHETTKKWGRQFVINEHKFEVDRNGTAIPRRTQTNAGGLNRRRI